MELHAVRRMVGICERHDLAFLRTRRYREMRRARLLGLDNKRMVAPDPKWRRNSIEQPSPVMRYVR